MHRLSLEGTFLNKDGEVLQEVKLGALDQPEKDEDGNLVMLTPTVRDYMRWVASMLHERDEKVLEILASISNKLLGADSDYTDDEVRILRNLALNYDRFPVTVQKTILDCLPKLPDAEMPAESEAPAEEVAAIEEPEEVEPVAEQESTEAPVDADAQ